MKALVKHTARCQIISAGPFDHFCSLFVSTKRTTGAHLVLLACFENLNFCILIIRTGREKPEECGLFSRIPFFKCIVPASFSWFRCSVGRLLESTFFHISSSASFSTGPCHSLLHPSKLTRLLGSPETQHLTDLPTVSLPQITPSLPALKTPLSIYLSYLSHNLRVSLHFSLYPC